MATITYNGNDEESLFGVLYKKLRDLAKKVVMKTAIVTQFPFNPPDPDEPFSDDQIMSAKYVYDKYQSKLYLATVIDLVTDNDQHYPSVKLITTTFQTLANLVTSFQATPDDTHYPSEKLVNDTFQKKALLTAFQNTPDNTHYLSEKAIKDYVSPRSVITISGSDSGGNYVQIGASAINVWNYLETQPVNIRLSNSGLDVYYSITAWAKDSGTGEYTFVTNLGNFTSANYYSYPKCYI